MVSAPGEPSRSSVTTTAIFVAITPAFREDSGGHKAIHHRKGSECIQITDPWAGGAGRSADPAGRHLPARTSRRRWLAAGLTRAGPALSVRASAPRVPSEVDPEYISPERAEQDVPVLGHGGRNERQVRVLPVAGGRADGLPDAIPAQSGAGAEELEGLTTPPNEGLRTSGRGSHPQADGSERDIHEPEWVAVLQEREARLSDGAAKREVMSYEPSEQLLGEVAG